MLSYYQVEPTKTAVVNAIAKHALKIYLEHVRLATFTVNGYQQIQVNLQYIKLRLGEWITDRETYGICIISFSFDISFFPMVALVNA